MSPVTRAAVESARQFLVRWAGPLVVAALFAVVYIQSERSSTIAVELRRLAPLQRDAQIAGCERGNDLRAQVTINVKVIDEFLTEAASARRQSGDKLVAEAYEHLRSKLNPIGPVDCEDAFPEVPR